MSRRGALRSPEMKSCLFLAVLLLAASGCGTEQSTSELISTPDLVSTPPSILTPAPSPAAAPTSTPEPTRTPTSEPIARDTPKPTTTSSPTITAGWYGLVIAPENRCSSYDPDDYRYSRTVEERTVAHGCAVRDRQCYVVDVVDRTGLCHGLSHSPGPA